MANQETCLCQHNLKPLSIESTLFDWLCYLSPQKQRPCSTVMVVDNDLNPCPSVHSFLTILAELMCSCSHSKAYTVVTPLNLLTPCLSFMTMMTGCGVVNLHTPIPIRQIGLTAIRKAKGLLSQRLSCSRRQTLFSVICHFLQSSKIRLHLTVYIRYLS